MLQDIMKFGKRFKRITYASMYDEAFASKDRSKWLHSALQKCRNSRTIFKKQYLKHLQTMYATQRIFEDVRSSGEFEQKFATEAKCVNILSILNLKRIQRQGLKRIYRPNGPMFQKSFEDLEEFF
tara:strand:- start:6283 stop:6657 length:375 start_codon:yes stop_codon:yes gene_type:complete